MRLSSTCQRFEWKKLIIHVSNYKMDSYCFKCKKNTENIDPEVSSTTNDSKDITKMCNM